MTQLKTCSVAAIKEGTVIDHITATRALKIVQFLKLARHQKQVTLGLNLPSRTLGLKDIIKVEERTLSHQEGNQVAVLAPKATINIISGYEVAEKFPVALPDSITGIILCPNPRCICNHEAVATRFAVLKKSPKEIRLECRFCRKTFNHQAIRYLA